MAQTGREHWRRAVALTFAGIFVVSLLAGLLGSLTRGTLALPPAAGAGQSNASSASHRHAPAVPARWAARGRRALLQLSDLPAGWATDAAAAAPARVSPWSAPLAHCVGVSAGTASLSPTKVESPDFTNPTKQLAVEDSVSVFPSAGAARAEYAAMASGRTTRCMNAVAGPTLEVDMQRAAQAGTTIGRVTFSALPADASAQHESGFTVSIPVAAAGRVLAITSTQVDFVQGALLHEVTFNGNGTSFPATLEVALVSAAQHRG
jgi:hypothetical protein